MSSSPGVPLSAGFRAPVGAHILARIGSCHRVGWQFGWQIWPFPRMRLLVDPMTRGLPKVSPPRARVMRHSRATSPGLKVLLRRCLPRWGSRKPWPRLSLARSYRSSDRRRRRQNRRYCCAAVRTAMPPNSLRPAMADLHACASARHPGARNRARARQKPSAKVIVSGAAPRAARSPAPGSGALQA